jgi:hypothetical protein
MTFIDKLKKCIKQVISGNQDSYSEMVDNYIRTLDATAQMNDVMHIVWDNMIKRDARRNPSPKKHFLKAETPQKPIPSKEVHEKSDVDTRLTKKDEKHNIYSGENIPVAKAQTLSQKNKNLENKINQYSKGDNTFRELLDYYHSDSIAGKSHSAVIDEDNNCLLATVAAGSRISLIIEGLSRSGKSLIADKLCNLLEVYKVEICSNKALFADSNEINKKDFIYISELQAALQKNTDVKETLKLLTENKNASNKSNGNVQTIEGRIAIISTGADENSKTQKRDVELSGRLVILRTRSDYEKIKRIAEYQDSILMGEKNETDFDTKRLEKLRTHLKKIVHSTFKFENPFARAYSQWLPNTQKSVHYRTLYTSLVNGFTLFDNPNRAGKNDKLFTNLSDVYMTHMLYHSTYCDSLKKLCMQSYESVEKFLPEEERKRRLLTLEEEISSVERAASTAVDWKSIWDAGYAHMKDRNFSSLDEWAGAQEVNGDVLVYDPVKNENVFLCKIN